MPMDLKPDWSFVTDGVMGGVSRGSLSREKVAGREAMRLRGVVSLDNNGGFLQMAFNLGEGGDFDASSFEGVSLDVFGNEKTYEVRLRTQDLTRPWQSYRAVFDASPAWRSVHLPFGAFEPNRTTLPFDAARLRRVGVLAIGQAFDADIAVARIGFYG